MNTKIIFPVIAVMVSGVILVFMYKGYKDYNQKAFETYTELAQERKADKEQLEAVVPVVEEIPTEAVVATKEALVLDISNYELKHNFNDDADGLLTTLDTQNAFKVWDSEEITEPLTISNGLISHGFSSNIDALSVIEVNLNDKVTHIGAKFAFGSKDNSGMVTLSSFSKSLSEELAAGLPAPDAGFTVEITPTLITINTFEADTGLLEKGRFQIDVEPFTYYYVEVVREGSKIYLKTPDQKITIPVDSANFDGLTSNIAAFGLYELSKTSVPAKIAAIWADSK